MAVRRGTLIATVSASGTIAPEAQVLLNFQTPGTVDKVNVVVGQKVKAGEVLAQLDTAELISGGSAGSAGLHRPAGHL